jgi:hypothetical protein
VSERGWAMDLSYELFLFGVAFFGFMAVVSVVQARRKKEKTYYLGAVVGFVVLLAFVFAFLNQPIFAFILIVATGILSIAGLPSMLNVQKRVLAKQLQEADLSAQLRVRDFFTTQLWLKLASKWGLLKTMYFYYLLCVVIIGGILFILSMFFSFMTIRYVVIYMVIFPIISAFIFYWQFKKVLEKK